MKTLLSLFVLILLFTSSFAQPGTDCYDPYPINSLPFVASGFTTAGFGNNYNNSHACGSVYMNGNDFVFSYTPTTNQIVKVKLTGTGVMVGVFVIQDCPNAPTAVCIAKKEETGGNPTIPLATLTAGNNYFIVVSTNNYLGMFPSTAFNIEVSEVFDNDASPRMISQPRTRCDLSNNEPVIVLVKNAGAADITYMQVGYKVNNGPEVLEDHTGTMAPESENYHTFNTKPDLSAPGLYEIKVFTKLGGEENTANDTITFPITNNNFISSYPYFQDFETGNDWVKQWISQTAPASSWEMGTPTAPIINTAASGTNCWVTNLSGNSLSPEDSYVQSPCFNFNGIQNPVLEMDINYNTGSSDLAYIQYSTDGAFTWEILGTYQSGLNWYNVPNTYNRTGWSGNSEGWIHVRHILTGLGGNSNVILRVVFLGSPVNGSEGFAFDNVSINEVPSNDLFIYSIENPTHNCSLNNDSIKVIIINQGGQSQTNFPLAYSIDNGSTWHTENCPLTLAFDDTLTYTFQHSANFSNPGIYNVIVKSTLSTDEYNDNDSLVTQIMKFPTINTFPYKEEFESNYGFWFAQGLHSTWEYGVPADTVITHAYSGTHAWVTNLTGYSDLAESSYIESPCFDISSLQNPKIRMKIWYELMNPDYCQLQYSSDGGQTWSTLGSSADWYPAGYSWTGSSEGWVNKERKITTLPDNFKLRFNYYAPVQTSGFAFDDFEICDLPQVNFKQDSIILYNDQYTLCLNNLSQNYDSVKWVTSDGKTSTDHQSVCFEGYTNDTSLITVTLIGYNNCGADSISLQLYPYGNCDLPQANFEQIFLTKKDTSYSLCVGNLSQNFDSVHWVTSDGQTSSNTESVCFYGYTSNSTPITVTLIAYNNCGTDTFSLDLFAVDNINSIAFQKVSIYPNPVNDVLFVKSDNEINEIVISDITGRMIKFIEISKRNDIQIPVNELPEGSYFITVKSKGKTDFKQVFFK